MNKSQLIGRLGADPETRYLPDGRAVTNLSIATSKRFKDRNSGEQREHTEWHKVVFFGKQAEIIGEHTIKGSLLYVEGELRTRSFEDNNNIKRYVTEILGQQFEFLGPKPGSQGSTNNQEPPPEDFDDDIPF